MSQLDKTDLLICDELGYLSFSKSGAELLFSVFAVSSGLEVGHFIGQRMARPMLADLGQNVGHPLA
jgi:hypothetical protein